MKKLLSVALFAALAASLAFADGAAVALQNEEDSTFYYVVDPPDLAGFSAGSPLAATRLAEYFAARSTEPPFTALAPGEQTSISGLANGTHLLVGFFATEDRQTFPVRVISLQADSSMGERFYAIFASPALVHAPRGVGRLAQFPRLPSGAPAAPAPETAQAAPEQPAQAGAQPAEAERAGTLQAETAQPSEPAQASAPAPGPTDIASFSSSYNPTVFTRESQGTLSVYPIEQSRSWNLAGTRITAISGRIDGPKLTLSLSVAGGFSPDVSYFFYVFGTRKPGKADDFTLELRPKALPDRGACLLWRPGSAPRLFGVVTVTGTTATLEASLADVPQDLLPDIGRGATFDLTSCRFDQAAGEYEEFYFATVGMADIPVVTR